MASKNDNTKSLQRKVYSLSNQRKWDKNRKQLNCPMCEAKNLRKLSNHLKATHNIDGMERKSIIVKARKNLPQKESFKISKVKRTKLDCPKCDKKGLSRLSNHLKDVHNITGPEKKHLLSQARKERRELLVLNVGNDNNTTDRDTSQQPNTSASLANNSCNRDTTPSTNSNSNLDDGSDTYSGSTICDDIEQIEEQTTDVISSSDSNGSTDSEEENEEDQAVYLRFTTGRTRKLLHKHHMSKIHRDELYKEYYSYLETFYSNKVEILPLKRYMGFKSDTNRLTLPWNKLGNKMLLRKFIHKLHTKVKCSGSLILNTLSEISRALSYALDIKAINANEKIEMDSVIGVLKKKYQKQRGARQQELLENHTKHMQDVSMEDLKKFLTEEQVEDGYYERIDKGKQCSLADMQYILGFLAAQITVNNAGRPGIFTNATIEEYNNREFVQKGKETVEIIYVKNHKTFNTHGSAKCTLKEREALAIKAYVKKIRRHFNVNNLENLFVTIYGNKVKNISSLIEKLWSKFDCPGHFTLNFMRKTVSTMVNEIGTEKDIETIDSKLLHDRETARRSYNAPTNAIALRQREVLDRILESDSMTEPTNHTRTFEGKERKWPEENVKSKKRIDRSNLMRRCCRSKKHFM